MISGYRASIAEHQSGFPAQFVALRAHRFDHQIEFRDETDDPLSLLKRQRLECVMGGPHDRAWKTGADAVGCRHQAPKTTQ
jgi:hypothetical protein